MELTMSTLAYSVPEACAIACAGRTSVYEAIRSGALRAVKRGRRTLILPDDLRRWVESLPPVPVKKPDTKQQRGAIWGPRCQKAAAPVVKTMGKDQALSNTGSVT